MGFLAPGEIINKKEQNDGPTGRHPCIIKHSHFWSIRMQGVPSFHNFGFQEKLLAKERENDNNIVDHTPYYDTNRPPSLQNKAFTLVGIQDKYGLQSRLPPLNEGINQRHWVASVEKS